MGVTLDAGALSVYQKCLEQRIHPLQDHIAAWASKKIVASTPSVAWAEYWRGRGLNDHYIAKIRRYILIVPVSQYSAESAADVLRKSPNPRDRNSVKHLIDAIVMAHANDSADAVYTTDVDDFVILWDCFPQVKSLISATTGEVVRKR